jgi:hypothetical protein
MAGRGDEGEIIEQSDKDGLKYLWALKMRPSSNKGDTRVPAVRMILNEDGIALYFV